MVLISTTFRVEFDNGRSLVLVKQPGKSDTISSIVARINSTHEP